MAELQTQRSNVPGGFTPTFQAADPAGDTFVNSGREVIAVQNTDTAQHTVTIVCQTPCNLGGLAVHNIDMDIPPGQQKGEGPISANFYNDGTSHTSLTYPNGATGLQVAIIGPY